MAIAVESYLHYWAKDVDNLGLAFQTKEQILDKSLNILNNRKRRLVRKMSKNGMEEKDARALLSGKAMDNIGHIIENTPPSGEHDFSIGDVDSAQAIINAGLNKINDVGAFTDLLNSFIDSLPQETKTLLNDYTAFLLENWTNGSKATKNIDGVDSQIMASLLGRYNNKAFQVAGKSSGVGTCLGKIYMAAQTLPNAKFDSSSYTIRHQGGSVQGFSAEGEGQLTAILAQKCVGWLREMDKDLKEISDGLGLLSSHKQVLELLEGIHHTFEHTGSNYYSVNFIPDANQQRILDQVKNNRGANATKAKKAKADFGVWIGEKQAGAFMGVNAKNYNKVFEPNSSSYDFKAQDETPLLTLLIRECGYSGSDLHNIYQLAVAVDPSDNFNTLWDELIENVKYRALLSVLAGLESSVDQSYYMAINGQFFTMGDFIRHIRNSSSTVGMRAVASKNQGRAGRGLDRKVYEQINRLNFQTTSGLSRQENAQNRSAIIEPMVTNIMYATKIRTEIHLTELANLIGKAL